MQLNSPELGESKIHKHTSLRNHDEETTLSLQSVTSANTGSHFRRYSESSFSDFDSSAQSLDYGCGLTSNNKSSIQNECLTTTLNILAKTDVAMGSLLVRLDQIAAQCSAAQFHGGGRLISEEKFQVSN